MADLYKSVFWNDGEGITDGDLNQAQRQLSAKLFDQILRATRRTAHNPLSRIDDSDVESTWDQANADSTSHCWTLTAGGGFVIPGGSARQTTVRAGTILQHTAAPDGVEEKLLPYTFTNAEWTLTHDIGDANPRIDLIEIQMVFANSGSVSRDFKDASTFALTTNPATGIERHVTITVQIKKGTPAATPTYPTLTSGFACMAAIYVPALHNAVFTRDQVIDTRFPLGTKVWDVQANKFDRGATANNWDEAGGLGRRSVVAPSSADPMLVYPPVTGQTTRVVGVAVFGVFVATITTAPLVRLVRVGYQNGTPTITELADLTTPLAGTAGLIRYRQVAYDSLSALSSGPDPRGANAGLLGDAFWTNGWRSGMAEEFTNVNTAETTFANAIALEINGEIASEIWFVRWFLAEGL